MACYNPLKGIQIPGTTKNGKPIYKIVPYTYQAENFIEIPCGKCIGCRLDYSRMWADRCMAEATYHEKNYFVTLTYDDEHLPRAIDPETGELLKYGTLVKRDVQLFMKRLRKNYPYENKIRFFMAGEYGSQSARPHYHAILFGLKLDDLKLYKKTGQGFNLYTSEWLNNIWAYKGYVIVADVTWETCAYTARYIMKKQTGEASTKYTDLHIIPEFTLMSRKPGIAKEFYEDNKLDLLRYGEKNISTPTGGHKIRSVKYFNKYLDIDYPEEYCQRRDLNIKRMEVNKKLILDQTDMYYEEMLYYKEQEQKTKIRQLPRKEI